MRSCYLRAIITKMAKRYQNLGVSAGKEEIHEAIKNIDKGLFPNAFCKILPDLTAQDPAFCNLIHADTAGTKTSLAYLYWRETGDLSVWDSIAQDALVMNIDDLACAGLTEGIIISSTIGRNKHLIPGEIISRLISANENLLQKLRDLGIEIYSGGGETADVGDIVRTIDVGITAFGRMRRDRVLDINIQPGCVILGFASFGQTVYEAEYTSGIGSNGLTAARHDALSKFYLMEYPESASSETEEQYKYTGQYRLSDMYTYGKAQYNVGKLLTSPTRTYLPLIRLLQRNYHKVLQALIHCTGGAQTKVLKFMKSGRVVKNTLFDPPPVFQLLKQCTLCSPSEMYEVYNMGHRLEAYIPAAFAEEVIALAATLGIEGRVIGYVESSKKPEVIVQVAEGEFVYQA